MCRSLVSVDWQGYLYDCDFNQQLGLAIADGGGRLHITRPRRGLDDGADPCRRPLLRLHRRPGFELRRRAGPRNRRGAELRQLKGAPAMTTTTAS
jgi:hypothetical protein